MVTRGVCEVAIVKITADNLRRLGATCGQVGIFEHEWPNGVEVTEENALRALQLGLRLDWYVDRALPQTAQKAYEKMRALGYKAYIKATAPVLRAYKKTAAAAWRKTHDEDPRLHWEACWKALVPARETFVKATASAWEAFEKVKAAAFVEACRGSEVDS